MSGFSGAPALPAFTIAATSGAITVDRNNGETQILNATSNVSSIAINNWGAPGQVRKLTLIVRNAGALAVALPSAKWAGGAPPIVTVAAATDIFEFQTVDGGATVYGVVIGQNFSDLASFLFYESFPGAVGPLNGRLAQKGGAHQASGTATMLAGGGILKQTDAAGTAGYDITPDLGQVPHKLVGQWLMTSGDFTYPATMGITQSNVLTPMLHGETTATSFALRLVAAGPVFIDPLLRVTDPNYSLSLATTYRDELHYNGGKMAAMVKRAADGTIIGRQLAYDFRMPGYVGNIAFWETLTDKINYTLETVEPTSDFAFPTVTELAGLANPTTSVFATTIFGGSVTNSGAGIVVAGASYGQGGQIGVGAVTAGDTFHVAFDAASFSGGSMEVALLKNGAAETEKSNMILFTAAGRVVGTLTATETMAGASVAIAMSPSFTGAGGCTVSNLQILKSPPTTP